MALSEFCSKNNIVLIALCPNATHILQPLDVAVFRPLKLEWKKSVHRWRMENESQKITKDLFAPILETTFQKMTNIPDIVKNGFRTCGLVPFNVENIKFSKYFKTNQETHELPAQSDAFLTRVEQYIPQETLTLFRSSGPVWNGSVEHTSLFSLWKKIKNRTATDNIAQGEADEEVVQDENEAQEDSIMEDIFTEEENHNEMDVMEINDNNQLKNDQFQVDDKFQNDSDEKHVTTERPNNNNEIDVTDIFDCTNLSLSVGIPEDIPIITFNTPDKSQHDAQLNVPIEKPLGNLSSLIEPAFQQMDTTQVATMPTEDKLDSIGEKNSNLEKELSPLVQKAINESIPTPFKKILFWPTPKENIAKPKVRKDKIPAVATSSQWQQYYKKKEEKREEEEQLKIQRKEKRIQKKEKEQEKKKAKTAVIPTLMKRTSNRRAADKLQSVTKKLFSTKGTKLLIEPSTSKPLKESWYCALCDTEDQLDMRLCTSCLKYYHEACLGLTEYDTGELKCPFCE